MSARPIPRWLGVASLLAIATSFASNHISARVAFDHGADVVTAVAVRSCAAALFVLVLMRAGGVSLRIPRVTMARGALVGVLVAVQSACLYSAVARIPVALALLVFNTFPMMLGLVSWAAGAERPTPRAFAAMTIALVGLTFALDALGLAGSSRTTQPGGLASMGVGVAFAVTGALAFAGALFLTTRWLDDVDGRLRSFMLMSVVAVASMAIGLTVGFSWPRDATGWTGLALLTVFYGGAITALFVLLPRMGAVNNAAIMNFEPVAALMLGWIVLEQRVAAVQILGAALVIGAIVLLTATRRP